MIGKLKIEEKKEEPREFISKPQKLTHQTQLNACVPKSSVCGDAQTYITLGTLDTGYPLLYMVIATRQKT